MPPAQRSESGQGSASVRRRAKTWVRLLLLCGLTGSHLAYGAVFYPTIVNDTRRTFASLAAAEVAMRAASTAAAHLQFDKIVNQTDTEIWRHYTVPQPLLEPTWTEGEWWNQDPNYPVFPNFAAANVFTNIQTFLDIQKNTWAIPYNVVLNSGGTLEYRVATRTNPSVDAGVQFLLGLRLVPGQDYGVGPSGHLMVAECPSGYTFNYPTAYSNPNVVYKCTNDVFSDIIIYLDPCPIGQSRNADTYLCETPMPPCPAGEKYNAATGACDCGEHAARDPATGQCVKCPVDELTELEDIEPNDPDTLNLTQLLENTNGAAGYSLLSPATQAGEQCLARKLQGAGIPYHGPSSTFRTEAYQKHLYEIWDKLRKIDGQDDPVKKQACAARRAEIQAEFDRHGLGASELAPAKGADGKHVRRNAFDIPKPTARAFTDYLAARGTPTPHFLNNVGENCNLAYPYPYDDTVHFQLRQLP